jgi:hypothetical protein
MRRIAENGRQIDCVTYSPFTLKQIARSESIQSASTSIETSTDRRWEPRVAIKSKLREAAESKLRVDSNHVANRQRLIQQQGQ